MEEIDKNKHYLETFQKLLPIAMGQTIGFLYKVVDEWSSDDWVISPVYSNSIEQGDKT